MVVYWNSMAKDCLLESMVYQWLRMRHQTIFCKNVKSIIIEESSSEIPDVVFDRAHGIGKAYTDEIFGVKCKIIIVQYTIFRHRTKFYHNKKNLKGNVKLKLDLTENCYSIFTEAMHLVKKNEVVKLVIVDINFRLKVVFKDDNILFIVIVTIYVTF